LRVSFFAPSLLLRRVLWGTDHFVSFSVSTGNIIASETEEDIFRILGTSEQHDLLYDLVEAGGFMVPVGGRARLLQGSHKRLLISCLSES
jgi:hypothetical protein